MSVVQSLIEEVLNSLRPFRFLRQSMDHASQRTEEESPINKKSEDVMTVHDESNKPPAPEEYDPSQPLDSSDEDDEHCGLQFDKDVDILIPSDSPEAVLLNSSGVSNDVALLPKEPDIDLNSIPMPSDEYRRPAIQFSIPSRHRLMSISSLIKRQKGVMKKQDKVGGSGLCYNLEVSKAFPRSDSSGELLSVPTEDSEEEIRKISLVEEIFGSDDEENPKDNEDEDSEVIGEVLDNSSQPSADSIEESTEASISTTITAAPNFQEIEDSSKRWKTVTDPVEDVIGNNSKDMTSNSNLDNDPLTEAAEVPDSMDNKGAEDTANEELNISIKPTCELMEKPCNEESSPEVQTIESIIIDDDEKGKENRHLECVSDEDADFEVTYVAIGKTNLNDIRSKQGRQERRIPEGRALPRKNPTSPLNGFEEGEIIEQLARKKKKAKKKKSKKRKRSKDSRSSKLNSERSHADSVEKRSFSDTSDSKEVSWRKPKITKSRNYRNGKRESEEKYAGERSSRHDDSHKRSRSPGRITVTVDKAKSRRQRSLSSGRFRSRSRSVSKDSVSRWEANRSRGTKRPNRDDSFRSRSSMSNHSSPSHSRSRSLTRKKVKRRHSPSPAKKQRNGKSLSRSPSRNSRLSKSPRPHKRNKSNGIENSNKDDRVREKSNSPADTQSLKKSSKPKPEEPLVEEVKKKIKKDKDKVSSDDVDKEKKKKRKRREKSVSPVKAIVADGDSIVVSLSFQKAKEEMIKTPKVTSSVKNDSTSEKNKNNSNNNTVELNDDDERSVGTQRSSPRKGTITINLDASPSDGQDLMISPDIIVLDEYEDALDTSSENKAGQDHKQDGKSSFSVSSQRAEVLDFVSSSHDCSAESIQNAFAAIPDPKIAASPAERAASASKSPYKFSEYFVSSTCDVGKTASPAVESSSPKHYTPSKIGDVCESLILSQKVSDNSPFRSSETPRPCNSTENGPDKLSTPSPESTNLGLGKGSLPNKPMIGNIPGLFPSGFSNSSGGMTTTAPIVIPAPPRIVPNTNPPNLLNPNVLVSVASALYAPLLAAKQHHNTSVGGPSGSNAMSNLQRHSQEGSSLFSRNQNSHGQSLGMYNNRTNNGSGEQGRDGGESPFSPNSSDGDDLFEPPGDCMGQEGGTPSKKQSGSEPLHHLSNSGNSSGNPGFGKYQSEGGVTEKRLFDTLFGAPKKHVKHGKKKNSNHIKKSKGKRGGKRIESDKNGEGEISARLTEDVPGSAVALKMKEKFLKKLNRQERVVEEVKLSLKPHYSKKHISKDEYKDILRRAVPKICHNKSGEINPNKIKELVEAYVKKFRKTRKSENKTA